MLLGSIEAQDNEWDEACRIAVETYLNAVYKGYGFEVTTELDRHDKRLLLNTTDDYGVGSDELFDLVQTFLAAWEMRGIWEQIVGKHGEEPRYFQHVLSSNAYDWDK